MKENSVLVITGPTASGKSKLALDMAKKLDGVIINCDSMQIYKDIPIIAASPSEEEQKEVEHRLFGIYDCSKRGNVVEWAELCAETIRDVWSKGKLPVVVGGTGMYVNALVDGVSPIPEIPQEVRDDVQKRLQKQGLYRLYRSVRAADKEIAAEISPRDQMRVVRALEIIRATKIKVSDWYKMPLIQKLPEAKYTVVKIMPALEDIEECCNKRLDKMVYEQGVLKEIETLLSRELPNDLPAMKALGVQELGMFIRGLHNLGEALTEAKTHIRQYAKRQRTWLRNKLPNVDVVWEKIYAGEPELIKQIEDKLEEK